VFLITKESDSVVVAKYKEEALLAKSRADDLEKALDLERQGNPSVMQGGGTRQVKTVQNGSNSKTLDARRTSQAAMFGPVMEDVIDEEDDATRCHSIAVWVAMLLVLVVTCLGYTAGLHRADVLAAWDEAKAPPDLTSSETTTPHAEDAATPLITPSHSLNTWFVTEYGQATTFSTVLVMLTILIVPILLRFDEVGGGLGRIFGKEAAEAAVAGVAAHGRVALVLAASLPTAYVWNLPVASKLGFANNMDTLKQHGEFDVVGVITTPQATGWMVSLFSLPLVALLRIAKVGGRGPQRSGPLRTTGVATVILFYLWLLVGCWMRAPVRYSFPAHGETEEENTEYLRTVGRPIPPGADFSLSPPYAAFSFPFRHPEHPSARYADLVVFAAMMVSLAAHAALHRTNCSIGWGGALLCVWLPCISAVAAIFFSAQGYANAKWGDWGDGALFDAWPLAVSQAAGLTGLAFLPLLLSPKSLEEKEKRAQKREPNKLIPGRSLVAPFVALFTFVTLPDVFRRYSFLADSDLHVDSRMDLSDPNILGAPCSAVTGAATLSSYVDSPFYAVLLGLTFFFPLLDMSASTDIIKRGDGKRDHWNVPQKVRTSIHLDPDAYVRKSTWSRLDAALSQSLCFALALFVAFPLSYDAALHRRISLVVFSLAAARAFTESFTVSKKTVAALCLLKFFAAFAAIATELPFTHKSIFPTLHVGGYVPCVDASPWVAESMALGLVVLTTSVHVYMARREDFDKHKALSDQGQAALF
jgi:hypothetical protein